MDCTGLRPTALATLPCRAGNKQGSRAFCGPPNLVRSSAGCERGHGLSRPVASRAHFCRVMLVPRRGSRVGAKHSHQLPEAAGETLRRLCWHCDLWLANISAWCTQPALRHAQHPAINRVRLECSSILKRARPNLACPPAYNLKGPPADITRPGGGAHGHPHVSTSHGAPRGTGSGTLTAPAPFLAIHTFGRQIGTRKRPAKIPREGGPRQGARSLRSVSSTRCPKPRPTDMPWPPAASPI